MRLFSNIRNSKDGLVKADTWDQIPEVKPNEILVVPTTNHLYHPKISAFANNTKSAEWYEQLQMGDAGLRRCSGLSDFLRSGYTIPMWAGITVRPPISKLNHNWDVKFDHISSTLFEIGEFTEEERLRYFSEEGISQNQFGFAQTGECPMSNDRKLKTSNYVKLLNPWLIKTAPGYSSLFIGMQWEPNQNYQVMAGVINTDYYHHANVVLNVKGDSSFTIKEGTPMYHIIPFKREDTTKKSTLKRGDSAMYALLDDLGFDGAWRYEDFAGKYKAEQNKVDTKLRKDNKNG